MSLKSSDVLVAVEAYRLFAGLADYPTHIGITEAGKPPYAVTKSAAGLAPILLDGIGDTIRISLLGDPVPEIAAAFDILQATQRRVRPAGTDRLPDLAAGWPSTSKTSLRNSKSGSKASGCRSKSACSGA